jgi:hypothetical protein
MTRDIDARNSVDVGFVARKGSVRTAENRVALFQSFQNQTRNPGATRSVARFAILIIPVLLLSGCSREWYRQQADTEVAELIGEKSHSTWNFPYHGIDMDPRSRFADVYDPVAPPMPQDDPESHKFMQCVDGMEAWDGWLNSGVTDRLENPAWREQLIQYMPTDPDGVMRLKLEDSVRLARIHSPTYHQQLETLYLSALDVSSERFRYDTQFFGGAGVDGGLRGSEKSAGDGSLLTLSDDLQLRRRFATAGELVIGVANSFMWNFSGDGSYSIASPLNFAFVQPLLRFGGRAVELERLTIAERTLLSNLRAFEHFRQGFYTQIAVGENGTTRPNRRGGFQGAGLAGFTGQGSGGFSGVGDATGFNGGGGGGFGGGTGAVTTGSGFAGGGAGQVGGFIGLLQTEQQIRNTQNSLRAQQQTLLMLEAHLDAGLIDIAQVDQFRQSIETERASLLQSQAGFADSLDSFKTGTLGLPPDIELRLDDELIRPFRFTDPAMESLQADLGVIIDDFGNLEAMPEAAAMSTILDRLAAIETRSVEQFEAISAEVRNLQTVRESRALAMSPSEQREFDKDVVRLSTTLESLAVRQKNIEAQIGDLKNGLATTDRDQTARAIIGINVELNNLLGELTLVQVRVRLETITLDTVDLEADAAVEIARANRLDWMNNRAALVDTWRLIEFNGNRLQSNLDIVISGEMGPLTDNPAGWRAENGSLSAGLRFDAPMTRLVERNNFRQQLIVYQQQRRQMIQFEDGVKRTMRSRLRELNQLGTNLDIQRRAVAISIRRVDQTRENLNRPTLPPQPGQPPAQFGPTAAINLLTALSDLRNTQNNFMSVWLNYYESRVKLICDLGLLTVDEEGIWIERPIASAERWTSESIPLPPPVPGEWFEALDEPDAPTSTADSVTSSSPSAQVSDTPAGRISAPGLSTGLKPATRLSLPSPGASSQSPPQIPPPPKSNSEVPRMLNVPEARQVPPTRPQRQLSPQERTALRPTGWKATKR